MLGKVGNVRISKIEGCESDILKENNFQIKKILIHQFTLFLYFHYFFKCYFLYKRYCYCYF